MAGVKPKFSIKWTQKGSATYPVPGNTYEDAFNFFAKKNAAKEEWGKFSPTVPNLSFKGTKGGPITEVELNIGYTITMPNWPKANSAGKSCQAAWGKMIAALKKHEEKHRSILEDECEKFGKLVEAKTDLDQKTLKPLLDKFTASVRAAQSAYDSQTKRGENEGVFLPAPDKCKD